MNMTKNSLIMLILILSWGGVLAKEKPKPEKKAEAAEIPKVIILPVEDKDGHLSKQEQDDLAEKTEKFLNRTNKFEVLTVNQRAALLNELGLDLTGLTKKSEIRLLESSDALLHVEIRTTHEGGALSLKLNLRMILRNGKSYAGSSSFEKSRLSEAVENSVRDLYNSVYPSSSGIENASISGISKTGYLWRSAVLPGWGQWKKDQKIKSSIFFFTTILAGGMYMSLDSKFRSLKSDVSSKESLMLLSPGGTTDLLLYSQIGSSRSELSKAGKSADSASLLLAFVYLVNLADAYFSKSSSGVSLENPYLPKTGLSTNVYRSQIGAYRENNFSIQYSWGF
ncbi:MAG: hypothetical protein IT569_10445 [Leptospiraceae bacterium]|nr:hypothetical protein [Leptospiraceae bacterium]